MNICVKCGSREINGPKYNKDFLGVESLKYNCVRCGYSESTPTLDKVARDDMEEVRKKFLKQKGLS